MEIKYLTLKEIQQNKAVEVFKNFAGTILAIVLYITINISIASFVILKNIGEKLNDFYQKKGEEIANEKGTRKEE